MKSLTYEEINEKIAVLHHEMKVLDMQYIEKQKELRALKKLKLEKMNSK